MVAEVRWNMLGHVLPMDRNAPAQRALQYAVEGAKMYSGRCEHHTTHLLDTLKADMKHREMNLHNINDLELLRSAAVDSTEKARWRERARID